jgi:hypothetical protein
MACGSRKKGPTGQRPEREEADFFGLNPLRFILKKAVRLFLK